MNIGGQIYLTLVGSYSDASTCVVERLCALRCCDDVDTYDRTQGAPIEVQWMPLAHPSRPKSATVPPAREPQSRLLLAL